MGAPTFADKVLEIFIANPNLEITLTSIQKQLDNLYTEHQIQTAILNLRRRGNVPIEIPVAGKVYRYVPGKTVQPEGPQNRLFEYVATLKTGALLLQDEEGKVYRAVEME